jgi:prevent-host-death family protein
MERAAAGERFLVTRRGKPYVRLLPAADPLPLAESEDEGRVRLGRASKGMSDQTHPLNTLPL